MIFESFAYFLNKIMLFSSFVNSASGFPKPLSPEEERKEFEKFKKGDIQAKNNLINHNLRLVAHIVKKYAGAGEADDLISVGTIGLIKAINTFEYDKNTQLSTYAARCIENEILMLIRVGKKHKVVMSLQEYLGEDKDGNEIENIPEEKLEEIANNALKKYTGPCFILTSSMNIDRLVTMSDVAKANGRIFAEDVYTANIAADSGIDSIDPNKSKWVKVYQIKQSDHNELISKYNSSKIGRDAIGKSKFIG